MGDQDQNTATKSTANQAADHQSVHRQGTEPEDRGQLSDIKVERLRSDTPLVAGGRVHLNNAGAAAQPLPVIEAVSAHLALEHQVGGYEAAALARAGIESARGSIGRCIGAQAGNIALVESATAAYAQALSSIDFEPGDSVVLSRYDYASNQIMAISLARRRGVKLLRAEELPEGGVDPDSVAALIEQHRPKLVSLTHVPTSSGLIQDAEAVGKICRATETPYIIDACQSVGQMPLDVNALGCDFLAATGRKFLRGPRGTGFLYVADRVLEGSAHPLLIDMSGADWTAGAEFAMRGDARRFELWESHVAGRLGLGAAAEYALNVGIAAGFARASQLASQVRERAQNARNTRPIDHGHHHGAIVSLAIDGGIEPSALLEGLRARLVNTSITDLPSAVLDLEERTGGQRFALRVSPHYYNTTEDLDALFVALEELL